MKPQKTNACNKKIKFRAAKENIVLLNISPNGILIKIKTIASRMSSKILHSRSKVFYFLLNIAIIQLMAFSSLLAQTTTEIAGKVTSAQGDALSGVSVRVKGSSRGTSSDASGNYRINVTGSNTALEFSNIGFATIEVPVNGRTSINVTLQEQAEALGEVVVVGYGTTNVRDLTGSVARVTEKNFNRGVNTSPDQLVQGRVAGVQVVNNSGAPGSDVTFRIRGISSVRSGNQPLFVVDGVPLQGANTKPSGNAGALNATPASNPLNFINPNDIESIDILKDATSTAIYGSRGANGVVIITTKKGKRGAPRLDINLYTGISQLRKNIDYMSADQYREAIKMRSLNATKFDGEASLDPFKEILRTGFTKNYDASISGGNADANYRLSGGYLQQDGLIKMSGLKKLTGNFYGVFKMLDGKLTFNTNIIASNTIQNSAPVSNDANVQGSLIGNAVEWNPTIPLRNPDGSFTQEKYKTIGLGTNPLALLEYYRDVTDITNLLGNVSANYEFIKGLDYKITLGINQSRATRKIDFNGNLFLSNITGRGLASVSNSTLFSRNLTHTLNYNKEFSPNFRMNSLLGYEYQVYKQNSSNVTGSNFTTFSVLGSDILGNTPAGLLSATTTTAPSNSLQSFFGRSNLIFADKYYISAILRADGSSKFGENNKYGLFPSVSGAWVLSREAFSPKVFTNLKLRAGWGITGNQEFPAGAAQGRYSFRPGTMSLANVANPNLKWETTETVNLGLDFAFAGNRLSGTIELFDRKTKDLLFQLPTIQPAPNAQYWTNIDATIINKGIELGLNATLISKKSLNLEVGVNATALTNKFTNYTGAPILTGRISGSGLGGGIPVQLLTNDQPLFIYNLRDYLGLDQNGAAIYSETATYQGTPNPKYLLGFNAALTSGKFDFSANFFGTFGHKLFNNTALVNLSPSTLATGRNASDKVGLSNESMNNAVVLSDRFLENGNNLRLSNATIGYNFGNIGKAFKGLRLYITGQNLFVITKYTGFDPEVNTDKVTNGVPSFGIDYQSYPAPRTFVFGINTSL